MTDDIGLPNPLARLASSSSPLFCPSTGPVTVAFALTIGDSATANWYIAKIAAAKTARAEQEVFISSFRRRIVLTQAPRISAGAENDEIFPNADIEPRFNTVRSRNDGKATPAIAQ